MIRPTCGTFFWLLAHITGRTPQVMHGSSVIPGGTVSLVRPTAYGSKVQPLVKLAPRLRSLNIRQRVGGEAFRAHNERTLVNSANQFSHMKANDPLILPWITVGIICSTRAIYSVFVEETNGTTTTGIQIVPTCSHATIDNSEPVRVYNQVLPRPTPKTKLS